MSFEKIGDLLGDKDVDKTDDVMAFFAQIKSVIKKYASVKVESITYKHDIVGVTVGSSIEASEIRLRHIQIGREISRRSGRDVKRIAVRVL